MGSKAGGGGRGGRGRGGGGLSVETVDASDRVQAGHLLSEINGEWPPIEGGEGTEGFRTLMAQATVEAGRDGELITIRDGGELVGVAAVTRNEAGGRWPELEGIRTYIPAIATKRPGYGGRLLQEVMSRHSSGWLTSAWSAIGFYRRQGLVQVEGSASLFYWRRQ